MREIKWAMKLRGRRIVFLILMMIPFQAFCLTVEEYNRLEIKAEDALKYCTSSELNTNYCFLVDMSMHSGKKRFFIWDFNQHGVVREYMVAHGICDNYKESEDNQVEVSNQIGSHCTSVGKYEIMDRGASNWGIRIKYNLKGLELTNSNAEARDIVLHSWSAIPDKEVYPLGVPYSWGCPAVSDKTMEFLDLLIRNQKRNLLLWVFK